ncbi:hypothetical protein F8M41_014815 [Gigaspora margarita]|uniref:Uncharacterized protein n=1 Tax=Gigaspora margarita TaxID=4874 RepID=A0A8H3ZZP4_GIGMA|nr:hypothetical protein F8M41_014815 [Gigaspora margarita]
MELILNNISYSDTINTKALNIFDPIIKNTLPSNYKYFIDDFEQFPLYNFLGAYKTPFKTNYHINIHTIEESKEWLQKFMDLHKVTMRETRGCTIKDVHYILSNRFHCIHSHAVKQKQGKKNNNESYVENTQIQDINCPVENTRIRDTNCPATLSIQVLKRSDPYPCSISLYFHHNHPLNSSHVMGFRPLSNETKSKIFRLFETGHNPGSAYHTYWEQLQLDYNNNEEILADRAMAPRKNDIFYLYKKHRDKHRVG